MVFIIMLRIRIYIDIRYKNIYIRYKNTYKATFR